MIEPYVGSTNIEIKCTYDIACILHNHLQVVYLGKLLSVFFKDKQIVFCFVVKFTFDDKSTTDDV